MAADTIQELLKPRYKVIADFPDNNIGSVGAVLNLQYNERQKQYEYVWAEHDGMASHSEYWFNEFPHLFKPLQWWEERKPEEMPEYVKGLKSIRKLLKVEDHGGEYLSVLTEGDSIWSPIWIYQPATKEEYESYLNKKNDT